MVAVVGRLGVRSGAGVVVRVGGGVQKMRGVGVGVVGLEGATSAGMGGMEEGAGTGTGGAGVVAGEVAVAVAVVLRVVGVVRVIGVAGMAGLAVQMGLGNMGVAAVWKAGVEWVGVEVVGMKVEGVVEVQESARAVRNHSGKALAPLHSCTAPSAVPSSPAEGMLPFSRSDERGTPALPF